MEKVVVFRMATAIGKSIQRKDAWDKVTGRAIYTDDMPTTGMLAARLLTSTCAHARILRLDISRAQHVNGVKAILTGQDFTELLGPLIKDRPPLARGAVRYAGEPVAIVVAQDEPAAEQAARLIIAEYEPLPVSLTPSESLAAGTAPIHAQMDSYTKVLSDIYPEAGTNIVSRYRMRKGNAAEALKCSSVVVEERFFLPPSDHLAMEVRCARAEISADGDVHIWTSSQAPYSVVKQIADAFMIPSGKIQVHVPFVGGGFGGKAPVTLEILAYLASRSVGGRPVRLTIPREQDMASMPCRMGLESVIKIGADQDGRIQAATLTYLLDTGAYADISPYMAKAIATDCTGPYNIENLSCDALCVYTNHTYATSYRGFSHESLTFSIERTMDTLARRLGMDPLMLRMKNAIRPGNLSPSRVLLTKSLLGDLDQCLVGVRALSGWDGGSAALIKPHTVRAMGIACLWKTENPPTDAISGAVITCNADGSVNLLTGVVEMGSDGHTQLSQMLAERLKMDADQVHVVSAVDTRSAPEHWKTVASLTGFMAGNAVMRAADDLLNQLRLTGSQALSCPASDVEVAGGRVFSRHDPGNYIALKDIVHGYKASSGESIGEPALGRGGFMLKGLSALNPETGEGKTGPVWTVGAQVVEVEADLKTCTYRIVNASTVLDVGKVINHESMRASIAGGMAMGVGMASREGFAYDIDGIPKSPNLRSYKPIHIGQEPDYRVAFVETPNDESPYGVRSYSEHGLIGMAAALGNALSSAFDRPLNRLPLTPETIWRTPGKEEL